MLLAVPQCHSHKISWIYSCHSVNLYLRLKSNGKLILHSSTLYSKGHFQLSDADLSLSISYHLLGVDDKWLKNGPYWVADTHHLHVSLYRQIEGLGY